MKYEDYESKINESVKNPDEASVNLLEVLSELKEDLAKIETMQTVIEEKDTKIRNLQDTNMKLFLSQTSSVDEDNEEDELVGQEAIDAFIEEIFK